MPLAELIETRQPTPVPSVIGATEIAQVRTVARAFENWDRTYGGGLVREAVVAQLRHSAELLTARCPERLRGDLFGAVGDLAHVTGFMAFDAYAHDDALRMFRFALACAEHAEDWHLRAGILASMARQAFWLNDPDAALTYIELAQVRADRLVPAERAMLSAVRARALAKLGRVQDTVTAVGVGDESSPGRTRPTIRSSCAGMTVLSTLARPGMRCRTLRWVGDSRAKRPRDWPRPSAATAVSSCVPGRSARSGKPPCT